MGDRTAIQWTEATWNPIRGCRRVSEGCRNCYAEKVAARFSGPGQPYEGLAKRGPARWTGDVRFLPDKLDQPLRWTRPRMVFVNSMSDMFHESLSNEHIAAVFGVMAAAPNHTFQVLTKRPKRMLEWFRWLESAEQRDGTVCGPWLTCHKSACSACRTYVPSPGCNDTWPLPNVWLGVSVEDQATADERIPLLLQCPAAVRWISAEPLLGPLGDDFSRFLNLDGWGCASTIDEPCDLPTLDWVVVGGESGPGARPCAVEWIRSVVQQCRATEVPVFVKQLGAHVAWDGMSEPGQHWPLEVCKEDVRGHWRMSLQNRNGGDPDEWPEDLRVREWPAAAAKGRANAT